MDMSTARKHPAKARGAQDSAASRRRRGFKSVAMLTERTIRDAAGRRGFAVARLLTHWPEVAGPELARISRPVKMTHGRGFGATLVLLTTGPHAPMLEMRLPYLRERVNACFGYNAVARIAITQTAATGFAEGQAEFSPAARQPQQAARPSPAVQRAAQDAVEGITDAGFRQAMQDLAALVLSRNEKN